MWFYGISGSGKTYASKYLKKKKKNTFLIDGDEIRSINSNDLGHSISQRKKQLSRLLNLSKLVIKQGYFPITSCVYVDANTHKKIKKMKIKIYKIMRSSSKTNIKLSKKENVVGYDLRLPNLKTPIIVNNSYFKKNLDNALKLIKN